MLTVDPSITITVKDAQGNIVVNQFIQQPYKSPLHPTASGGKPIKLFLFKNQQLVPIP